jgi:hypothetical protein
MLLITYMRAETTGQWQNIRFSGKTAASEVLLRVEVDPANLVLNKCIYETPSGLSENDLLLIDPATNTYQGTIPVDSLQTCLGLRLQREGDIAALVPVYYAGTGFPELSQLTLASADTLNDNATDYYDIVADYASFSDTKLHTAIQNRGGGFPTIDGFIVNSYMNVIAEPDTDPNDPNVTVWALNYMDVAVAGYTPGLYKITGTGIDDLVQIGDISYEIDSANNLLKMSCDVADLLADPDFAAWFDPADPEVGMLSITGSTDVLSMTPTTQDTSPGARIYLDTLFVDPVPNTPPIASGELFQIQDGEVFFSTLYQDNEANFPLTAQIELNDGTFFDLLPQSLDFSLPVLLRTQDLTGVLAEYDDGQARVVLSDDNINFYRGNWFAFTYILGVLRPEDVNVQISDATVSLSWDPVTQTLLGNPVTPDHYRIEASFTPDFSTFDVIGSTPGTSFSHPENPGQPPYFYRIIAVKGTS